MPSEKFIIRNNYPGGNIKIIDITDGMIKIEQEIRDSTEWWFYWNFRIENPPEKEYVFEFTNGEVIGPWGPAASYDGINWGWLGKNSLVSRRAFKYNFDKKHEKVFLCFSLPYQVDDFDRFYLRYKCHRFLQRKELTVSEQGRPIPLVLIGNRQADRHVFMACRHHACESVASYLLEGLLAHYLDQEKPELLNKYLIHIVPFVDIDGVENGDQGKCRNPHDHNRDYIDSPLYRTTAAIMEYCKSLHFDIYLDFHCPWKWSEGNSPDQIRNDYPFFAKEFSPIKEETEKLGMILKHVTFNNNNEDKIVYDPVYDIEMGEDWMKPEEMEPASFRYFARKGVKLAAGFELPYFGTGNKVYTQKNTREFGRDFGRAMEAFLIKTDDSLIYEGKG